MLSFLMWLVAGLLLGALFLSFAGRGSRERELHVLSIGLFVAALLYLGFSLLGGAQSKWILMESAGVLLYGAVAWAGVKHAPRLLALGWALHMVWDAALHLQGAPAQYTPGGYALLCIGFDLLVAGYILRPRPAERPKAVVSDPHAA
ncbi:MAG TPA: DUF6010 family protein [Longimicrobiaceae bacterium]|nr:DUF6010 family protein [Longimicrobiaceae bacterium]